MSTQHPVRPTPIGKSKPPPPRSLPYARPPLDDGQFDMAAYHQHVDLERKARRARRRQRFARVRWIVYATIGASLLAYATWQWGTLGPTVLIAGFVALALPAIAVVIAIVLAVKLVQIIWYLPGFLKRGTGSGELGSGNGDRIKTAIHCSPAPAPTPHCPPDRAPQDPATPVRKHTATAAARTSPPARPPV